MNRTVLLLATMDTKGHEALYLRDVLRRLGAEPCLMDLSMRHSEPGSDISADAVAEAGGSRLEVVSGSRDMAANMKIMVAGASRVALKLIKEGGIGGAIGVGGYTGSFIITAVMQNLPFGLPKIMVSSAAAIRGLSNRFLRTSDIMLFHSVVDIAGLSGPVRNVLDRAAAAMCGMLRGPVVEPAIDKARAVALSMMSPCEACARAVRRAMEEEGYQVIGFHANGIGDRAMEIMIGAGLFRGVIDLAPGGVGEHLYGLMRDAGPDRLETAGKVGIPQIISTCGVNHITPHRSKAGLHYGGREKYDLDELRTWIRMTPKELREVAQVFAEKVNKSFAPVKLLVPLRGWSSVDVPGSPTYNPAEDYLFVCHLKTMLRKEIEIIEVDANMEDGEVANAIVQLARNLFCR